MGDSLLNVLKKKERGDTAYLLSLPMMEGKKRGVSWIIRQACADLQREEEVVRYRLRKRTPSISFARRPLRKRKKKKPAALNQFSTEKKKWTTN